MAGKRSPLRGIAVILAAVLLFAGAGTVYTLTLIETQREETEEYLYEVANQEATIVAARVEGNMRLVKSISLFLENFFRQNAEQEEKTILPILKLQNESYENDFMRMGLVFPDGKCLGVDEKNLDISRLNYLEMDFIQQAFAGQEFISDTRKDTLTGTEINTYSIPIYDESGIMAAFFAVSRTSALRDSLSLRTFGGKGYAHVVNGSGQYMVRSQHSDIIPEKKNCFDLDFENDNDGLLMRKDMEAGKSGVAKFRYQNETRWDAYVPVGIKDWYVLSIVPDNALNTKFVRFVILTVCALVLLAAGLLAFLLHWQRVQSKHQKTVIQLAYFDSLTGAYNRNKFNLELGRVLQQKGGSGFVMVMNMNNFKAVNELFGVARGNALLKNTACVLADRLGENDFFARGEADTFYLYVNFRDRAQLTTQIRSIMDEISSVSMNGSISYTISLRCGAYRLTGINENIDSNLIVDRARLALTAVANRHSNQVAFYDENVYADALMNSEIESMMHTAKENGEFLLYLQPQYSVKSEKIAGVEALTRWNNPTHGLIMPDRFVPLFEENGFATELDNYMLEQVCRLLRSWLDAGRKIGFSVSVNQSRLHLYDENYVDTLKRILGKYSIPADRIQLEMTESAAIGSTERMVRVSRELHQAGFRVSMDDFGSGYSSLNVLKDVYVDELKLDKQFFAEASDTSRGREIIVNLLRMANRLSIHTVAEGIERREQVEFLREHGCELIQGYYYAQPMPVADFEKLVFPE